MDPVLIAGSSPSEGCEEDVMARIIECDDGVGKQMIIGDAPTALARSVLLRVGFKNERTILIAHQPAEKRGALGRRSGEATSPIVKTGIQIVCIAGAPPAFDFDPSLAQMYSACAFR
jgi:hypothetical protein